MTARYEQEEEGLTIKVSLPKKFAQITRNLQLQQILHLQVLPFGLDQENNPIVMNQHRLMFQINDTRQESSPLNKVSEIDGGPNLNLSFFKV